ncbi:MAG: hypothetical protein AAFV53_31470 [Myxococcota bacterium]
MVEVLWYEDRFTNIAVQSGRTEDVGSCRYGPSRLLPSLSAQVAGPDAQAKQSVPGFALHRRLRLVGAPEGSVVPVTVTVGLPMVYGYTFSGRPMEPAGAPAANAPPIPFLQRVEVDGEVTVRLIRVDRGSGRGFTVPGSMRVFSVRRSGARQGHWAAARRRAVSQWEAIWSTSGADDLFTVSGPQQVSPQPRAATVSVDLPVDGLDPIFGVELTLTGLTLWVRQQGLHGAVEGTVHTDDAGLSVDIVPTSPA